MNTAVIISGSGSNLQAFIDASQNGQLDARLAVVLSNRADAYGLQRAAHADIAAVTVDHRDYSRREDFDQAMLQALAPYAVDLIILAGFMRILTPVFISAYRGRLLNIHPSLLPKYPGLNTHQRALDAGDEEAGATVHFVTEELDGGPPILQASVPIVSGDDSTALAARVLEQEHRIYPAAAQWFAQGRLELSGATALLDGAPIPACGVRFQAQGASE
ncbi:MAG: phosphoribosylglycinamide formyltransferase [Gammaproteobacteria bacterium]|nr:phosphoribosylglycinamide formyltransferase [Gammaproteobacteria bacterium]